MGLCKGLDGAPARYDCDYCQASEVWHDCDTDVQKMTIVRLGAGSLSALDEKGPLTPILGLGRRYEIGRSAVEVSGTYAYTESDDLPGEHVESYYYSIPKILYLNYAQPNDNACFFYGAGLSWGGVTNHKLNSKFRGILGDFALGYEMQRNSPMRALLQLDVAQPLIASKQRGDLPPATVLVTLGFGF
jgi:hypothetical protein